MRVLKLTILSLVLMTGFAASLAHSAPPERASAATLTKQRMVGAWRLVRSEYSGPSGPLADPLFGPDPQGIIIYDRSGWMSVQIVTVSIDKYYAYFGTWDFDPDTSVVTHHITSSLLPYETGLEYRREVTLDRADLQLTARLQENGEARQRTLLWTRVSDRGPNAAVPPVTAVPPVPPVTAVPPVPPVTPTGRLAGPSSTKYGDMPVDYKDAIDKYFLEHLKYPESLQYQTITEPQQGYTTAIVGAVLMSEKREYGWKVKATINAKNSHDAYVGFKTYTFLFRGEKIVDTRAPLPGEETN